MLFSVLCTMLLGLCIMKREGRRVIMSLWRIVPCHCSARSGFPRLKPARVAFAPFARQKAFSFALELCVTASDVPVTPARKTF